MNLAKHPYFEAYTDPQTGIVSYLLTKKPTPITQSFYFINQTLSADRKYLWMYCAMPPLSHRSFAVVGMDENAPFLKTFPYAVFWDASPMVAPDGESVFFTSEASVYRLHLDGTMDTVGSVDKNYIAGRYVQGISTHLTLSADGQDLLLDGKIGNEWFVGTMEVATGKFTRICTFGNCQNHGQFSPVDAGKFLLDEDWWVDPVSGKHMMYNHRIWLYDRKADTRRMVAPDEWTLHNAQYCHDFWAGDGTICWIDYETGAYEADPVSLKPISVWPRPLCHAHCTADRQLWVADQSPYRWQFGDRCQVLFFQRPSGKETAIFSDMPAPYCGRDGWHIDPHPQFTPDGKYVVGTTTVRDGQVDLFLTPVEPILRSIGK